jgi:hypothetical protein
MLSPSIPQLPDNQEQGLTMIPSFDEYAANLKAQGYEEVLVRNWSPREIVETHRHPFAAKALVVSGEMWLTQGPRRAAR